MLDQLYRVCGCGRYVRIYNYVVVIIKRGIRDLKTLYSKVIGACDINDTPIQLYVFYEVLKNF